MGTRLDGYVDMSKGSDGAGDTPATAMWAIHQPTSLYTTFYADKDYYIWVRRANTTSAWPSHLTTGPFRHEYPCKFLYIKWPMPGEEFYDIRPAAGISAGWDADPDIRPTYWDEGGLNFLNAEYHGIKFYTEGTPTLGSTGYHYIFSNNEQPRVHFYDCEFVNNKYYATNGKFNKGTIFNFTGGEWAFHKCVFTIQIDSTPYNGGSYYFTISGYNSRAVVTCVDCTFTGHTRFDGYATNQTYNRGGIIFYENSNISGEDWDDVTFVNCSFPSTGGWLMDVADEYKADNWLGEMTTAWGLTFIGCDFNNGAYTLPGHTDRYYWLPTSDGSQMLHWCRRTIDMYGCVNYPVQAEFHRKTHFYTLTSDTNNHLVVQPQDALEYGLYYGGRRGKETKFFINELLQWPPLDDYHTWFAEIPAGAAYRVTVNVKCRNWSTLPRDTDFYLYSYNLTAVPPTPAAKYVFSPGTFSANDTWTAYTLDFDASTVATYVPIFFVIKRYESATADIVIDPTVTVTPL